MSRTRKTEAQRLGKSVILDEEKEGLDGMLRKVMLSRCWVFRFALRKVAF